MNDSDGHDDHRAPAYVVRFPQTRVRPPGGGELRELGFSKLAQDLGFALDHATGHWCSRCRGVWYGAMLEVACPVCGNRNG